METLYDDDDDDDMGYRRNPRPIYVGYRRDSFVTGTTILLAHANIQW